ncbi:MAG: hypothetical protein JXP34_26765 [Planctomycetes bacterium]|nr:hypothetical protein [Planctomycetota bacterium]
MRWTKERPRVTGFYWHYEPAHCEPEIHHVDVKFRVVTSYGIEDQWDLDLWCKMFPESHWCGPLQSPVAVGKPVVPPERFVMPDCPKCGTPAKVIDVGGGDNVPTARCGVCSTIWQPERVA